MTSQGDENRHLIGIALVITSALAFSLAGIFTKAVDADLWTIACWRGLIGGLIVTAYVVLRSNGSGLRSAFRTDWQVWLLATVGSLSSLTFILAFKLTYVANVAIAYATVPFMAAGLAAILLGERFRPVTAISAIVSLGGVVIMVAAGIGTDRLPGDLVALLMTLGNALYMVLIRLFNDRPVVWAGALSALQLFVVSWLFTDPLAVSTTDIVLLAAFGLSFALAVILWTEGTRLLAAAESGLFGSAETPFAILLAWLILSEMPPVASLIGGMIVLAAVFAHAGYDVWRIRTLPPPRPLS